MERGMITGMPVLSESVRHHIKEEEGDMLPKAKVLDLDFEALGEQMLARKKELKRDGIPEDAEHAMIAAVRGRDDSPAARARRTTGKEAVSDSRRTQKALRSVRSGRVRATQRTKQRGRGKPGRSTKRYGV